MRLKGGGRGHRRLLLIISSEGGEDFIPPLPFILLVFVVLLRHCLLCDLNSPNTAAVSPREPPPQPSLSAAAAKSPKSLPAPAVPSAAVSLASPFVEASRRRVGVIHCRRVCRLGGGAINSRPTSPRPDLSDARRPGPLLYGSVVRESRLSFPTLVGQGPSSVAASSVKVDRLLHLSRSWHLHLPSCCNGCSIGAQ